MRKKLFSCIAVSAAEEAPLWLRQAAVEKLPDYGKKVNVAVLHDESKVVVSGDGHVIRTDTCPDPAVNNTSCYSIH